MSTHVRSSICAESQKWKLPFDDLDLSILVINKHNVEEANKVFLIRLLLLEQTDMKLFCLLTILLYEYFDSGPVS